MVITASGETMKKKGKRGVRPSNCWRGKTISWGQKVDLWTWERE